MVTVAKATTLSADQSPFGYCGRVIFRIVPHCNRLFRICDKHILHATFISSDEAASIFDKKDCAEPTRWTDDVMTSTVALKKNAFRLQNDA